MIETDMLPISVEEGEGLKELIQNLKPKYMKPSRASVTKHFEEKKDELKFKQAKEDKLALTTGQLSQTKSES